jgi:Phosphodiester glycosidase
VRAAAAGRGGNDVLDRVGDLAELDGDRSVPDRDECPFGERAQHRRIAVPVVRDADAAGIGVERVADPPCPLQMRVPAREQDRVLTEERLDRFVAEFRHEHVVVGMRRPVEEDHGDAFELSPDDRREGANLFEVRGVQLRQRPLAHLEEPLGDRFRGVGGYLEEEVVGVAEHRLAAERGKSVERLPRLGPALGRVPEAHDLVDSDALEILDHHPEGDVVAVLVGDECEPHAARLPSVGVVFRRSLIVVVLAAGVASAVASAAVGSARRGSQESVTTSLMPGVTYTREVDFTVRGPIVLDVVTAPKPDGTVYSLAPALSNNALRGKEALRRLEGRVAAGATTVAIDGDDFDSSGAPSGIYLQNGVISSSPADGRSSLGIEANGTLTTARVSFSGVWQGKGQRRPLLLNSPAKGGKFSLYTPTYGTATPHESRVVEAVIGSFPHAQLDTPLDGTVTQVTAAGPTRIPPGGAVIVARGSQSTAQLKAEAPVGQKVEALLALSPDWSDLASAIGGGPLLVKNGKPIFHAGESFVSGELNGRRPRSAIGQLADGRIVLVSVEGTKPAYSIGMSNYELAVELSRLGATTAFGLGSGSASGLAFDGGLLTRPSNGVAPKVSDALVLSYTGLYAAPPSAAVLSPNHDGVDDLETLSYRVARPSHLVATLAGPGGAKISLANGPQSAGLHAFTWNGTDGGAAAAEGTWTFSVTGTDDRKVSTSASRTFSLDDTLSSLSVATGVGGLPTATFQLTRPAKLLVQVERPTGVPVATLRSGQTAAGAVQVTWRGRIGGRRARSGRYQVVVHATGSIGTSSLAAAFSYHRSHRKHH